MPPIFSVVLLKQAETTVTLSFTCILRILGCEDESWVVLCTGLSENVVTLGL